MSKMNLSIGLLPICLSLALAGCGKPEVQCSDEAAREVVTDLMKDQLQQRVTDNLSNDPNAAGAIGPSKIKAAIAKLSFMVDDIRTAKEDPNSTKRHCTGSLKIRFPVEMLNTANKTRSALAMTSVSDFADASGVERAADNFTTELNFSIQPTDDGKKIFAETESENPILPFSAEILASDLLNPAIEGAQRQQQIVAQQQEAASQAALDEQRKANLALAQTENKLAVQVIGALWQSLPADTREQLLPLQRAWIRKKNADCRVEAAGTSTDPSELETARLGCETRENQSRTNWLRQYQNAESDGSEGYSQ